MGTPAGQPAGVTRSFSSRYAAKNENSGSYFGPRCFMESVGILRGREPSRSDRGY